MEKQSETRHKFWRLWICRRRSAVQTPRGRDISTLTLHHWQGQGINPDMVFEICFSDFLLLSHRIIIPFFDVNLIRLNDGTRISVLGNRFFLFIFQYHSNMWESNGHFFPENSATAQRSAQAQLQNAEDQTTATRGRKRSNYSFYLLSRLNLAESWSCMKWSIEVSIVLFVNSKRCYQIYGFSVSVSKRKFSPGAELIAGNGKKDSGSGQSKNTDLKRAFTFVYFFSFLVWVVAYLVSRFCFIEKI